MQTSASAATAFMLSSLDSFASPQSNNNMNTNFKLKILATSWGFDGTTDQYCAKAKKEGYDGIETWWPMKKEEQDERSTVEPAVPGQWDVRHESALSGFAENHEIPLQHSEQSSRSW